MATKSIIKNVDIKTKRLAASFVAALEHAEGKAAKEINVDKKYQSIGKEDVKKLYGEQHGRL